MPQQTQENDTTYPIVLQKGLETGSGLAIAGDSKLVDKQQGRQRDGQEIRPGPGSLPAQQHQPKEHHQHQAGDDGPVMPPEQDGRGFDADFQIVFTVHHGVERVVNQHPAHVDGKQRPGQRWDCAGFCRKGHGYAPAKGKTQHDLRPMGIALEKRITGGKGCSGKGQQDGQVIGLQYQQQGQQQQQEKTDQGLFNTQLTAGQRPAAGALHVRVEITVGDVIHHATRCAHDHYAQGENHDVFPSRLTLAGNQQSPPGRPQQQQHADGAIKPHQSPISVPVCCQHSPLPTNLAAILTPWPMV